MGMVEKVARAMVAADSGPEGSTLFAIHLREFGDGYRSAARAAIEAMREPSVAMQQVVSAQWGRRTWAQYDEVIDAALKETTP